MMKVQETTPSEFALQLHYQSYSFREIPSIHFPYPLVNYIYFFSSYRSLTFVYPFGATLNVMKPAVAVLSTGSVCFPLNRPILAFYDVKVISCPDVPIMSLEELRAFTGDLLFFSLMLYRWRVGWLF